VTDTRTQVERHELIPGVSAYALWRAATIVSTVLSICVGLALGYSRVQFSGDRDIPPLFWVYLVVPLTVDIAASVTLFAAAGRRAKAETSAGYTTRTNGYSAYDQVDPRSGLILRRAGSAVLTIPTRDNTPSDGDASAADIPRFTTDANTRRRQILIWISAPILLVIIFAGGWARAGGGSAGIFVLVAVVGLLAVILVVVFVSVRLYMRAYLRTAAHGDPGSFVFLSRTTPELVMAALSLGITPPTNTYFGVAITNTGLELWPRKTSSEPFATLPWSTIKRVQPARLTVSNGRSNFSAATLHVFTTVDGQELDLPLPVFGPRSLAFANAADANKVLDVVAQHARIA
jgi:hypothetical protein